MHLVPLVERITRSALTARGVLSRHVKTSVADHHVYDAPGTSTLGKGALPTIVLLHGIGSSAAVFAPTLARLRRHARRVLAIEAPGHGLSGEPRVPLAPEVLFESTAEVIHRELTEPAFVCGNSLGGAVAVHLGLRFPEIVRGLFLTSPAGAHMDADALRGLIESFDLRSNREARAFMHRLYHRPPWFAPILAPDVRRTFTRQAVRDLLAGADVDKLFSAADLASLKMPVYLLWGKSDRLLPRESFEFYRSALPPHAIIEEQEDVGHCPHLDDPSGFSERILRFTRDAVASAPRS